ncbi:MAG: hypothetical protein ACF8CQ_15410, partial [Rhodopirellula sp. JB044]|uniref:hypothetical protein n=1 Tax=Rhodopirellula sp. JB044 TaxID=3342844 RepID=UPI00370AC64E
TQSVQSVSFVMFRPMPGTRVRRHAAAIGGGEACLAWVAGWDDGGFWCVGIGVVRVLVGETKSGVMPPQSKGWM